MTTVHAQTGIKLATKPAKTSLLGGHFIYKANGIGETPSSANVVEWVDNDPTLWRHNVHIGSNGIKLRYGETTLSKWDTNSLIFYKPRTEDGSTVTNKGIELSETNGLVLYKTTFDASNLTAEISESTITNVSVGITPATFLSMIDTVGEHRFTYSQADNGFLYGEEVIRGADLFDVFGIVMQPDADEHIGPFDGEYIVVKVFIPAVVEKGIQLTSTGLEIFGSSQSTADVIVNSSGIKLIKGGIEAGTKNTTDYIYVWSNDDSNHSITIGNSTAKTDWRIIAGNKFGVDKAGNVYATNADITGIIKANEGSIGGANGWTVSSQEIKSTNYDITDSGSIYLSTKDLTTAKTINGQSRTDWRFTIGDKFGVTKDGYLYADGLNITNIDTSSITVGPVIYYGVCSTAQSTQIKEVTIDRFQLVKGATVVITFVNGNSNSAPSLKINDGNAIAIKAYDGTSLSSYEYSFTQSNVSRTFTYNGTYWLLQDSGAGDARSSASSAAYTAYNYITHIDSAGIFISPSNQSPTTSSPGNSVKIDGNGMNIYKSGISIAEYGEDIRLGKENEGKLIITAGGQGHIYEDAGMYIVNDNNDIMAQFLESGCTIGKVDTGIGVAKAWVYIDSNGLQVLYGSSKNKIVDIGRGTENIIHYTFGTRSSFYSPGAYSIVMGENVAASGRDTQAMGYGTEATGSYSHAEGYKSHAYGDESHAEGKQTSAQQEGAHAEGISSYAYGVASHAQNDHTVAQSNNQTALGTYNIKDYSGDYAVIIGNGGSESTRSNALAVDWNGNITVANHSSHIGDVKSHAPSDVSCSDKKYYQLAYLTLDPGVWIIDACGRFPDTNTTGMRQIRVSAATSNYNNVSDAPQAVGNIAVDARPAVKAYLYPNVHFPVKVTSTTTYRVIGYQSSGSAVSVSGRIYATRIQ